MASLPKLFRALVTIIVHHHADVTESALPPAIVAQSLLHAPDDEMFITLNEMMASLKDDSQYPLCDYIFYGIRVLRPIINAKSPLLGRELSFVETSLTQLINNIRGLLRTSPDKKERIVYKEAECNDSQYLDISGLCYPAGRAMLGFFGGTPAHFTAMGKRLVGNVLPLFQLPASDSDAAFALAVRDWVHEHERCVLKKEVAGLQRTHMLSGLLPLIYRHHARYRPRSISETWVPSSGGTVSYGLGALSSQSCPRVPRLDLTITEYEAPQQSP